MIELIIFTLFAVAIGGVVMRLVNGNNDRRHLNRAQALAVLDIADIVEADYRARERERDGLDYWTRD